MMIRHKSQFKRKARVVQEKFFLMTIQKIRHKELNETFFKTVFYDDNAQNSGQARGKSLTKSKTESLNKMHSHLIQAYIRGLLSHHS